MDTSETYIKMSDCEEVQKFRYPELEIEKDGRRHYQWDFVDGDFFITICEKHEDNQIEIKGTTVYSPYCYTYKKTIMGDIDINQVGFDEGAGYCADKIIWLPRQDQIQEMLEFSAMRYGMFKVFCDWLDKNRLYIGLKELITPEQLWLAFYMHEKHSMTWDGERWQKRR